MYYGHIVYLCASVKRPVVKGNTNHWNKKQDTGWAKTNKEDPCRRELARGSVYIKDEVMTDVFARSSRKVAAQVCTKYMIT